MVIRLVVSYLLVFSPTMAQRASLSDPGTLVNSSSLIVIGVIEDLALIVHPNESNNVIELGSKHVVGFLYRLRVQEVIRKDSKIRNGVLIGLFVPRDSFTEGAPAFVKGERFLVFLASLRPDKEKFGGAMIHEYGKPTRTPFDPKGQYLVVQGEAGAVKDAPKNKKIIEDVRRAVASPH